MSGDRLITRFFKGTWNFAWAFTLVALPVTSFPLLSKLAGGTLVAPLSLIPLVWLFITWLPYYFYKTTKIPGELRPLIGFVFIAVISSLLAFFYNLPNYKEHNLFRDEMEALITLGIGLSFLLITFTRLRTITDLRNSLKWINIGGIIFIGWSMVQILLVVFARGNYPFLFESIQRLLSVANLKDQIRGFRISGLTLEPSWLAHSLNLLYIPIWLVAVRYRISAFKLKIGPITLETILLTLGCVSLVMTFSRIGLIGFLAILVWFMVNLADLISQKITLLRKSQNKPSRNIKVLVTSAMLAALFTAFVVLLLIMSIRDNRLRKLIDVSYNVERHGTTMSFTSLVKKLNIAERVFYWQMGWNVFNQHPILGVGLGNVGRYAESMLPSEAWKMPEIKNVLFQQTVLPNTKNLWTRILAETGMLGITFFLIWLILMWAASRKISQEEEPIMKAVGLAGQLAILAYFFEGFSLDTFALPYIWVILGFVLACITIIHEKQSSLLPTSSL